MIAEIGRQNNRLMMMALGITIFLGLVLFLAKIVFYTVQGDDPWFAEQAYWLAKDGVVRSEFFANMLDYGTQQFAYHKLHIWIAALAIKLFGLSYLVLKSITLAFFCAFLLVMRRYFYTFFADHAKNHFLTFLAFIMINSLAMELVFVYRPEMAIMCFGFVEYYFLRKSVEHGVRNALLAGVFAGLCGLMHLNGLIFMVAGAVLLLADKKIKLTLWFGLAASAVASLYFIDILPGHWATYWMQFRHDPAIPRGQFSLSTLIGRILFEYDRFFGHGYESGYSLLVLAVIIANYRSIWQQSELRHALIYFAVLSLTLAAISPGKNHYYLLYGMPYTGILVASTLWQALSQGMRKARRRTLVGFSLLYILANVPHALAIIHDGTGGHHLVEDNAEVMRRFHIQPGDKVLAPLSFIFNGIEQVGIQGTDAFFTRSTRGYIPQTAQRFFQEASDNHRKFILIFGYQLKKLKPSFVPVQGRDYYGYTYLGSSAAYRVFERTTE